VIPRYLPALDFKTAAALWSGRAPIAGAAASPRFPPDLQQWHGHGFDRGRDALAVWLRRLAPRTGGEVVVSAQICPAVRHAIAAAGSTPVYVDIDEAFATPAPAQFTAALNERTAAIVIAPFYGYVQSDWGALAAGSIPICVDMAQGLLLEDRIAPLIDRASAVLYSFSVGKGLDLGGAALFTREPLPGAVTAAAAMRAGAALNSLALRAIVRCGLYPMVLPFIERAIHEEEHPHTPVNIDAPIHRIEAHRQVWASRAAVFQTEVARARQAARRIASCKVVAASCRDLEVYGDPGATHLRQVLRLQQPDRRAAVLRELRRRGVDCAPAGEPFPPGRRSNEFPNADRFTADAIRLPFLGRLSDAQCARVERVIEIALG
jgi:dTDP-4-amino-4,6-dideoxygalactose transaminase